MGDNNFKNDAKQYFGEFSNNLFGNENPYKEDVISGVVDSIESDEPVDIDTQGIEDSLEDESNLGLIQTKFGLFPEAENWKDVAKEMAKIGLDVQKEFVLLQTFGSGIALVVLDNVTGVFKFVVGPAMIRFSYNNSKVLQKLLKEKELLGLDKIDLKKGLGKEDKES